jgi:NTE family protein
MSEQPEQTVEGVGLALSGGGCRASLFHLGSLWRLNELGWLKKINEITSVSGAPLLRPTLG